MTAWSILWLGCAAPQQALDTAWSPHLGASEGWSVVVINEFMASNASGLQDDSGAYPDWIELYNPTEEALELDGWMLSDDRQERDKHVLQGQRIDAGGWLLLVADGDTDEGDDHLGFSLSADGEDIGLYSPDGGVVDEVEYGPQQTDHAAARQLDGGSEWMLTDTPTPGTSNGASP